MELTSVHWSPNKRSRNGTICRQLLSPSKHLSASRICSLVWPAEADDIALPCTVDLQENTAEVICSAPARVSCAALRARAG
eukprot:11710779-Prorocentrum_lima.AAC.1